MAELLTPTFGELGPYFRWSLLTATLLLGLGIGWWLTPRVRRGALRLGVLDRPDSPLKTHREPIAYLGGIAVYLTFILTLSFVIEFRGELLGLLLGSTIIVMLGLFDDLKAISPGAKLLGQLLAAWVTLRSGITIELVALPIAVALPLSVFWIIGVSNAFNIIDVSDGLASATGATAALWFAVIATFYGDVAIGTACCALAGACFGVLRLNWPSASIYLGDAGSLFIGFLLACIALIGSYTVNNVFAAVAPVMILTVPILDTALVSMARLAKGMSPMNGSDDHFAIRLKAAGWSAAQVATAAIITTNLGGVAALVAIEASADIAAFVVVGYATACLVGLMVLYFAFPTPSAMRRTEFPEPIPQAAESAQK